MWIRNATVKDNILFGKEFDSELYDRTLEACALVDDLKILDSGDMTEIGKRYQFFFTISSSFIIFIAKLCAVSRSQIKLSRILYYIV